MKKFKLKLTFLSLVSMSSLIGFCGGVVSIPIGIAQIWMDGGLDLSGVLIIALLVPVAGSINGLFLGVLAYPIYAFVTTRIGFKYQGAIYPID